ncbi:MAG: alpha/beta fold hydrolase [Acutalibacteraceae bacterium]
MAIIKKEAYFNSSTGVNKIRTLIWQDDDITPVAVLQIAHGVAEHIGRYDDFARFLASHGFIVCGNDHLGHGKSVNSPEELGFTAEKDGYRRFVDDMHILYSIMHRKYPELPYYLFGHSMGSLCARVYASTFGTELSGLIICGTAQVPSGLDFVINTVDKLVDKFGPRTVNHKVAGLLNAYSLFVPDRTSNLDWLSVNKQNIENYKNDPLCGAELSLAGMRDLLSLSILASDKMWPATIPTDLPIMIISGAKDPVGGNSKGVIACSDSLTKSGHEPTVIIYPTCRHEILNEDCKDVVYNDVLGWLQNTL